MYEVLAPVAGPEEAGVRPLRAREVAPHRRARELLCSPGVRLPGLRVRAVREATTVATLRVAGEGPIPRRTPGAPLHTAPGGKTGENRGKMKITIELDIEKGPGVEDRVLLALLRNAGTIADTVECATRQGYSAEATLYGNRILGTVRVEIEE